MSVYTYLIKSELDQAFYIGISENPEKRLLEHNSGKLKGTARKKPWKLVYFKDRSDYAEARKHEKWLKKKNRAYKEEVSNSFARPAQAAGAG
jgi:putative endonuclease